MVESANNILLGSAAPQSALQSAFSHSANPLPHRWTRREAAALALARRRKRAPKADSRVVGRGPGRLARGSRRR